MRKFILAHSKKNFLNILDAEHELFLPRTWETIIFQKNYGTLNNMPKIKKKLMRQILRKTGDVCEGPIR